MYRQIKKFKKIDKHISKSINQSAKIQTDEEIHKSRKKQKVQAGNANSRVN